MRLSKLDWDQTSALVLDYYVTLNSEILNSGGNYTFLGDTTYYISGPCFYANVNFEGGTVIKYASCNSFQGSYIPLGWWDGTAFISVYGTLTCQTSSYHPAVFTAVDDDTVGEKIDGSTGNPNANFYANPAIFLPYNNSATLSNVRISYAYLGVLAGDGCNITFSDSQVTDSAVMALLGEDIYTTTPVTFTCNNCLYNGVVQYGVPCGLMVFDSGMGSDSYFLNNCTIANVGCLGFALEPNTGYAFNSIFANLNLDEMSNIPWDGNNNGFYNCQVIDCMCPFTIGSIPSVTYDYPFQTAGGGNYYLAVNPNGTDASGFRGIGTTSGMGFDPAVLPDLAAKTTYPPNTSYVNQTISADTSYRLGALRTREPRIWVTITPFWIISCPKPSWM